MQPASRPARDNPRICHSMRQTVNDFLRALIAGVLISLGCAVNAKVGGVVGALLFACGLCTIIQFRLPLFTGIVAEKPQWSMLAILAGNCAGAVAGHYLFGIELAPTTAPLLKILCGGTGTGILMVAAYKSKSFVVAILGVMLPALHRGMRLYAYGCAAVDYGLPRQYHRRPDLADSRPAVSRPPCR